MFNLNFVTMRKLAGLIAAVLISYSLNAQKSIDDLFAKYAGKEGFTTVTINGNLLKLAQAFDNDEHDKSMPKDVSSIRILSQEGDSDGKVENFYDAVIKDIDLTKYEEFMNVQEKDQKLKMLVKMEGNKFTEFLMISGGKDNALIQIKGSMSLDEVKNLSKEHGSGLMNK